MDHPSFEILIFAYSIDKGPKKSIDLTIDEIPAVIQMAIKDISVIKTAWNAQFERVCLSKHLGLTLDPTSWRCTMIHATELGLPASLGRCAKYLGLDEEKDTVGKSLIRFFSVPCKPTRKNGMRTRNLPEHDEEKWQLFIEYCEQDVVVEMAIADKLDSLPVHPREWEYYATDQRINDRGVEIDSLLVESAISSMEERGELLMAELKEVTKLENPNSLQQFKGWLDEQGYPFDSLSKDLVKSELASGNIKEPAKRALEIRLESSNSSTKKYLTMERACCTDGRIHGLLQFYGASRTGRWAGRLVQVQNLPKNKIDGELLEYARDLVKIGDIESLEMIYDTLPAMLKQLIRTALVAKEGHTFHVSDFSAIEARVIAWYAGEKWRLDVFKTHGKIYEASASAMFHIPIDSITKDSPYRAKGKVAELALGYQGGPGALITMGALENGIKEEELQGLVDAWRKSSKKIVRFWYDVQGAAIEAIKERKRVKLRNLQFSYEKGFLRIKLPSGRYLSYAKVKITKGQKFGNDVIQYEGQGDKAGFSKLETYGGKLVENIVQATARDILAEAMLRVEKAGYDIVFHVHDEVVCEVEKGARDIEELNEIMSQPVSWSDGLPLGADGYETDYYMKD